MLCGGVLVLPTAAPGPKAATSPSTSTPPSPATTRRRPANSPSSPPSSPTTCSRPAPTARVDASTSCSRHPGQRRRRQLRAAQGLQQSVEIIANEVLDRLREAKVKPREIEDLKKGPFAKQLTHESLRYLYRILFLLYAEARPELGILPADDSTYEAGYSIARLRELVARERKLVEEDSRGGFHLYASLDVLFNKVNFGHRPHGTEADDDKPAAERSEQRGLRFEPLRSELFDPKAITLIGSGALDPDGTRATTRNRSGWI
ncbi:hypothetical protein NKH18_06905 [Streptomyces sp. M10(2022)]